MKWGGYKPDGNRWKEKSPCLNGTWGSRSPSRTSRGSTTINLRTASHAQLTSDLGLSNYFAKAVREILRDNPSYDVADLISGLKNMEDLGPGSSGRGGASEQRKEAVKILNKEKSRIHA